jgi:hypothetical protein
MTNFLLRIKIGDFEFENGSIVGETSSMRKHFLQERHLAEYSAAPAIRTAIELGARLRSAGKLKTDTPAARWLPVGRFSCSPNPPRGSLL